MTDRFMLGSRLVIEPPLCARCGSEVQHMVINGNASGLADFVEITVQCHGETETMRLSYEDITNADKLSRGVAFRHKREPLAQAAARKRIERRIGLVNGLLGVIGRL